MLVYYDCIIGQCTVLSALCTVRHNVRIDNFCVVLIYVVR